MKDPDVVPRARLCFSFERPKPGTASKLSFSRELGHTGGYLVQERYFSRGVRCVLEVPSGVHHLTLARTRGFRPRRSISSAREIERVLSVPGHGQVLDGKGTSVLRAAEQRVVLRVRELGQAFSKGPYFFGSVSSVSRRLGYCGRRGCSGRSQLPEACSG